MKLGTCEECGQYGKIHTHHKNRDHSDNGWDNLKTLCPSCHGREHSFEGLEASNSRFGDAVDCMSDYRTRERLIWGFNLLKDSG